MRRKLKPNYDEVMKMTNSNYEHISTSSYRNLLDNIHNGCYVEAQSTHQYGKVEGIIRNLLGVPVCLKVRPGSDEPIDYISVDRISFWEPCNYAVSDSEYETTYEEDIAFLEDAGYHWDESKGVYRNDKGDEVIW